MTRRKRSESAEARRFAVILAILLGLVAALSLWKAHPARAAIAVAAAVGAVLLAFAAGPLWIRIFRLWMRFAEILSWVSTRVILTAVFLLLLTPYAIVARLFRKDPLDLDWRRRRSSYWIEKPDAPPEIERYERQY